MLIAFFLAAVGILPMFGKQPSVATHYTVVQLPTPAGSGGCYAIVVNDRGQAAGECYDRGGNTYRAVEWTNGIAHVLFEPRRFLRRWTWATSINDKGDVVGYVQPPGVYQALWWHNGKMTVLPALPGTTNESGTTASVIRDDGLILGSSGGHSVEWANGAVIDMGGFQTNANAINAQGMFAGSGQIAPHDPQGGAWIDSGKPGAMQYILNGDFHTRAYGINDAALVVGVTQSAGANRAWAFQSGNLTYLPSLSASGFDYAEAVNDQNIVVGYSLNSAVRWYNGAVTDLNSLISSHSGVLLEEAGGISGNGLIACFALAKAGGVAVILYPAP